MSESLNAEKVDNETLETRHVIAVSVPLDDLNYNIKLVIYSRASVVKWLVLIDFFFLTLNLIISIVLKNFFWLFFFFSPLCYCGWKGATTYDKNYLWGYIFYLGIMSIFYFMMAFYYNSFFLLFIFAIESYLFAYTFRLHGFLKEATNECIQSLREGWNPNQITYYYL